MRSAVIGAGSWGTALAALLCEKGPVGLWARNPEIAHGIQVNRTNPKYQKGFVLPDALFATDVMADVLKDADLVCVVVPSHAMRAVIEQAQPHLPMDVPIVSASKGIENASLMTMEDLLIDTLPDRYAEQLSFLSGPSFAQETLAKMATAVTIASRHTEVARRVQEAFSTHYFRAYTTEDVTGVELGGALKNVVAIAAGCVHGLGLGHNTMAALLTRGLAEITRLAVALGAHPLTLSGLSGMGDLVLTCTGSLSRNRTVGYKLGQGQPLSDILNEMKEVAEGVRTTKSAYNLSHREAVEMPIVNEVYEILYHQKPCAEALGDLMGRRLKRERT